MEIDTDDAMNAGGAFRSSGFIFVLALMWASLAWGEESAESPNQMARSTGREVVLDLQKEPTKHNGFTCGTSLPFGLGGYALWCAWNDLNYLWFLVYPFDNSHLAWGPEIELSNVSQLGFQQFPYGRIGEVSFWGDHGWYPKKDEIRRLLSMSATFEPRDSGLVRGTIRLSGCGRFYLKLETMKPEGTWQIVRHDQFDLPGPLPQRFDRTGSRTHEVTAQVPAFTPVRMVLEQRAGAKLCTTEATSVWEARLWGDECYFNESTPDKCL